MRSLPRESSPGSGAHALYASLPVPLPGSCFTHHLTLDRPIAHPGELVSRDAGVRIDSFRVGGYLDLRPLSFTFGGCGNSESAGFFFLSSGLSSKNISVAMPGQERTRA